MTVFWAKTTPEGKPGISVYDHMVNVGCVAHFIAETVPELLDLFHLQSSVVGALASLHDLGKISPGFQRKCEAWLKENNLVNLSITSCWDTSMESDHGKVSHAAIQDFLLEMGIDRKTAKYVSTVLGGHHGYLDCPNDRGYQPDMAMSENYSNIDWDAERMSNARQVWDRFLTSPISFSLTDATPALWWLAGLTSVADWIGSDERFFSTKTSKEEIDKAANAARALDVIGLHKVQLVRDLSFHDLFHDQKVPEKVWIPNEMQKNTHFTVSGPGVYVIEAPMGMGKTEAALWAAYRLLVLGRARGIYFALPTQVTSNRIHLRMNDFLRRIAPETSNSYLIHGNSWLMETDNRLQPAATGKKENASEDARVGRDWFTSTKRALIAPFGVGTVDQALLGIVAAKHFFVRHFALAGKVVILDEIHSYDLYTGTLIDKLITTLEGLGCTIIVLSATLTGKRKEQIVSRLEGVEYEQELPYPLITGRKEGHPFEPVAAKAPQSQHVTVEFVSQEYAADAAVRIARKGGAVLWVCNTIDSAQELYQRLKYLVKEEFPVGLLHSRFPFWRREELEAVWMERLGKNEHKRCASILVATQVVEQSVDLDADLLISELAPTDMLLQRIGRLWRHDRKWRPIGEARIYIIKELKSLEDLRAMEPEAIVKSLGNKAYVYAPYVLLRTLELWRYKSYVSIPLQIRTLIESTYRQREKETDSWEKLFEEWFGTDSAKKMEASRNSNLWQVTLEDEEGIQTRINETPTASLVLCRKLTCQDAKFIDQSPCRFDRERYQLSTAQAIHKNLVKVPEHCFEHFEPCHNFKGYLFGKQSVGLVGENGAVDVRGLKDGVRFFYSEELGLIIEKSS